MPRAPVRFQFALGLGLALASLASVAAADLTIYSDAVAAGWDDYSYSATVDFANVNPVHGGVASIAVTFQKAYAGFSLRTASPLSGANYSAIRFWVFGSGNTEVNVYTQPTDAGMPSALVPVSILANGWTQVVVPLIALGSPAAIARINIQDATGVAGAPTFYIDDLALVSTARGGYPDPTATRVLGQFDFFLASTGVSASMFNGPAGVAVGPDDRLFVVDYNNNRVLSWPSATGFYLLQAADLVLGQLDFGSNDSGAATNRMNLPESVAVDRDGNVWVADTSNHRVMVFEPPLTTNMAATVTFGSNGCAEQAPLDSQFCFPRGIAIDTAGNVYVADEFRYRVVIYQTPLDSVDFEPDRIIEGLGEPRGVAVDANGTLFVADSENDRVQIYESPLTTDLVSDGHLGDVSDGSDCETPLNGFGTTKTGLACPIDLAVDGAGNLFVSDLYNNRILAFADPVGGDAVPDEVYGQMGSFTTGFGNNGGGGPGAIRTPLGIAFDAIGGLYLADFDNNRVLAYPAPVPEPGLFPAALAASIPLALLARRRTARWRRELRARAG